MKHIYIISLQRDSGKLPEIYSIWTTYEMALKSYYDHFGGPMYLYKFPINESYCDVGKWCDIKLGKSCKYRLKFINRKSVMDEYISISRDNKLTDIIGG